MSTDNRRTVVLGLGNPLMADDGIGLAALERLRALHPGMDAELVDGGTWGMSLLPVVEDAEQLILLDAIHLERPPGTVIVLERHQIPRYLSTRISPHEVALQDVLALAELRGNLPDRTVAMGIQPQRVEMSVGLSSVVAEQIEALVATVFARLAFWRSFAVGPFALHA